MPAMLYNTLNLHYQIKLRDYMKKSRKAAKALCFYLKVAPIFSTKMQVILIQFLLVFHI